MMRRTVVLAAALAVAAGRLPTAPPAVEAAIDQAVRTAGVTDKTPGVAVLVIDRGKVVVRKAYGLANLKDGTPVRPETTFELASVSKQFTAVAVCRLSDRGRLAFEDPARKYVPELPESDPKRPIRIVDLLRHTSGLPDYTGFTEPKGRDPKYVTNEDYARLIARRPKLIEPTFPCGQKYEYSNTNYMLLGLIVERVSKKSYGTFLREDIFEPLGMTHSWVYERPGEAPRHPKFGHVNAIGYEKDKGKWSAGWGSPPFRSETLLTVGDGGIWTNLDDMARWDEGVRSRKLLKPETWAQVFQPSKLRNGKANDYGFGWSLELGPKGQVAGFWHNGSWGGFHTSYARNLPADRAVVVLSNRGDFDTEAIHTAVEQAREKGPPGE
jgi:CubicO group peptidase (beta-lactamase class C family)